MHGFKLTDEVEQEGFSGGTIQCGPLGEMFDVGKALADGEGVIYTDDDIFASVLASYPALERVSDVPKDATAMELPYKQVTIATEGMAPWTPQNPTDTLPQQRVEIGGDVRAEHADDPATPEDAVKQGEAVSGSDASQGEQEQSPSSRSSSEETASSSRPGKSSGR